MAKRKPKNEVVKETIESTVDELLGSVTVEVKEPEVVATIIPEKKEKKFYGYHPITGAEVWL